jgi:glycosyltransferase involved in cell wall biosynthesis
MRVLHFFKTYKPDSMGGVEELIGQICSGAAKRGVTSEVLTVSDDTSTVDFGDHVHYRAKRDIEIASSAFSIAAFKRFSELAARADLIHYHFPWPFADVVHFATHPGKPSVVTYHSDIVRQKFLLQFYKPLRNRFWLASTASSRHRRTISQQAMYYNGSRTRSKSSPSASIRVSTPPHPRRS